MKKRHSTPTVSDWRPYSPMRMTVALAPFTFLVPSKNTYSSLLPVVRPRTLMLIFPSRFATRQPMERFTASVLDGWNSSGLNAISNGAQMSMVWPEPNSHSLGSGESVKNEPKPETFAEPGQNG